MRIKLLPNIILLMSITVINLFVPQGQVLYTWKSIIITKEALYSGIEKSALLIGLMYLSKNITFSHIKIPGRAGVVIRDTFHYFNQLSSGERIGKTNIINQIDNKLMGLTPISNLEQQHNNKASNYLYIIMIITVIAFLLDNFLLNF